MITTLTYFGTALDTAGHYFWKLEGNKMIKDNIYFKDLPFNPDQLVNGCNKGTVKYFVFEKYKICAISGSCYDQRGGTKSIFWTTEDIKLGDFKDILYSIPIAKKILDKISLELDFHIVENKQ